MARNIQFIVLHCTASPQTQTKEAILNYWKSLGWKRPGYHRLIMPDGIVHELLTWDEIGNGVKGFNASSIHISYVGGVDANGRPVDNRTDLQKQRQKELIEQLSGLYPTAVIQGHRDFSPDKNRDGVIQPNEWMKACPSFSVKQWLNEIGFKAQTANVWLTTTASVNIRAGAGKLHAAIAPVVRINTKVKYIGEANGWKYVQLDSGTTGWISGEFLK